MEAIFREAKEEQERADQAFEEEQQREETLKSEKPNVESNMVSSAVTDSKPKRRSRKASDLNASSSAKVNKFLVPGSTVRVVSGTFAEYVGSLKKLNRKTGKVCCLFHIHDLYYSG